MSPNSDAGRWLARFHAGDRQVVGDCYREYFVTVERAVRPYLWGADRETAIHEVFFRLLTNEKLRRSFDGAALAPWLATVARNHAIDYLRHHNRERLVDGSATASGGPEVSDPSWEDRAHARIVVDRFRRECLPRKWDAVFEARFLRHLPQREAAAELGMSRTTLAYQELRVRALLRKFLLKGARK